MKIDYPYWLVIILVFVTALLNELRSAQRPRLVWLYGSLIGVAAYLPAQLSVSPNMDMVDWAVAVFFAFIAAPIHYAVDLTSPLWGSLVPHVGLLGLWMVVALTAGLFHGSIAVWLGRMYRSQPARALATGVAVLALNLCLLLLQSNTINLGAASSKAQAHGAAATRPNPRASGQ